MINTQELSTTEIFSHYITRAILPLLVIFIVSVIQGFRFGFLNSDYLLLSLGSLISIVLIFGYGALSRAALDGARRSWMSWSSFLVLCLIYFAHILFYTEGYGAYQEFFKPVPKSFL